MKRAYFWPLVVLLVSATLLQVFWARQLVHAQPPTTGEEIWHGRDFRLFRFYDQGCTFYVVKGAVNAIDPTPVAIGMGPGCQR